MCIDISILLIVNHDKSSLPTLDQKLVHCQLPEILDFIVFLYSYIYYYQHFSLLLNICGSGLRLMDPEPNLERKKKN